MSWTCPRVSAGQKCRTVNASRAKKCRVCGKPRPKRRRPAHMRALDIPYERYVELNGEEVCGICKRPPTTRRLDRDHCHRTGKPRGALCHRCNRMLASWLTPELLRAAADYLERFEETA